jgi:hypothetical protein
MNIDATSYVGDHSATLRRLVSRHAGTCGSLVIQSGATRCWRYLIGKHGPNVVRDYALNVLGNRAMLRYDTA